MKFWLRNILMNPAFAVSIISIVKNLQRMDSFHLNISFFIIDGTFLDIYIYCIKKSSVPSTTH